MNPPDPYVEWDAAYVLGALEPTERREFEAHLAGCARCRDAVAELAGMPGILGAADADVASRLVEPAPVAGPPLDALAAAARRARVQRRGLLMLAASGLLVAGVGLGFAASVLTDESAPTAEVVAEPDDAPVPELVVELTPAGPADVTASLVATSQPWGTDLSWSCRYPDAPGYEPVAYELVLVGHDGERSVAASWTATGDESTGLRASSAVPLAQVSRVEIVLDGQETAVAAVDL